MPIVATGSSCRTQPCSFEYLSPGGASIYSSPARRARIQMDARACAITVHQARRSSSCQAADDAEVDVVIGVPKEIKPDERRVAITPAGAAALRHHGHTVIVERGAGSGSGFSDSAYRASGAQIGASAAAVWKRATMVLKVKEPQSSEYQFLR